MPGRTVTEVDNVLSTTLTMNTQSLHLDGAFAAQHVMVQRLVNSHERQRAANLNRRQYTLTTLGWMVERRLSTRSRDIARIVAARRPWVQPGTGLVCSPASSRPMIEKQRRA